MIEQAGSVLTYITYSTDNTGTVATNITVPSDAQIVIVGISGYANVVNYFSSGGMTFTKGGTDTAMTSVSGDGDASTDAFMAAMFYLVSPDTGTNKTLKWDWLGTSNSVDVPIISITFWKGIDTASPVRGSGGGQNSSLPYETGNITAQTGDKIIAWVGGWVPSTDGSIDSWTRLTELADVTYYGYADGAWATGDPTGTNTVAAASATNFVDGGIVAVALKPAVELLSLSDSGYGSESSQLSASLSLTDTGAGTDDVSISKPETKSVSDASSGTESLLISASLPNADNGSGTDQNPSISASLSRSDVGTGADTGPIISVSISYSDSGTGVDSPSIAANLGITDGALGGDYLDLSALLSTNDTGSGSDDVTVLIQQFKSVEDSANGSDEISLQASLSLSDISSTSDTTLISVQLSLSDSSSGVDNQELAVTLGIVDAALGGDFLDISSSMSLSESGTGSESPQLSANLSITDVGTASEDVSALIAGSVCWGHITGVLEDNIRTFVDNWSGTGLAENSGDAEQLKLGSGEYMISEVVLTGALETTLLQNEYESGDTVTLQYRHGTTEAECLSASWSDYSSPFISLGYVQVRVESTL